MLKQRTGTRRPVTGPQTTDASSVRRRDGTAGTRPEPDSRPGSLSIPAAAAPRTRRNPKWIALGVIAICLGALASVLLYSQATQSHQVVAVRSAVARGTVITAADLTVITVGSTTGIRTVDGNELSSAVGHRAAVDLPAGSLLPPDAIAADPLPPPGRAIVGIRLADGRAPRAHLDPGNPVRVVALPAANTGRDAVDQYAGLAVSARVVDVAELADGQSVVLDVDLAAAQAAPVAQLAAQDRVVVIRDAEG